MESKGCHSFTNVYDAKQMVTLARL